MMPQQTVFMFSGQGSQHYHMARAMFDSNQVFARNMRELDELAGELCGESVIDAIYGPNKLRTESFDRLMLSHPAIFMVEYSLAQTLCAAGIQPTLTLGTSLGSFAAAAVSGFVEVETAFAAVVQQAAALEACCDAGAMIAVLAPISLYEELLAWRSELAAINFRSHFVISAPSDKVRGIESDLLARGAAFQRLPVTYAFHSSWIDAAKVPFAAFMDSIQYADGEIPLACCEQGEILERLPDDFFWRVVREPIRFTDAVDRMERDARCQFIDVGPSSVLATFLKHMLPPSRLASVHPVLSAYGHDRTDLEGLAAALAG